MTSNTYGPNKLGYTRTTLVYLKSYTRKKFGVNL